MKAVDPVALFRLSVLGPLVSRERLEHGELQRIIRELALREYAIPGSRRCLVGEKTIEAWYYANSDVIRPVIPITFGHLFRWDSATDSEAIRPPPWAGATRGNLNYDPPLFRSERSEWSGYPCGRFEMFYD